MEDYAGRLLADRYRLPRPSSDASADAYDSYGASGPYGADPYGASDPYGAGGPMETRAYDTYSGQEVHVRRIPLPEVVEAEFVAPESGPGGGAMLAKAPGSVRETGRDGAHREPDGGVDGGRGGALDDPSPGPGEDDPRRHPADPVVRRAVHAAAAAAGIPDHPRLDQVFDVFADGGSLWIVSERVAARPLSALLADRPLPPHRAAEVAADIIAALRAVHAHGWTHRNITARTVLLCEDGRAILTGLAAGAAEDALCGYAPAPSAAPSPGTNGAPVAPEDAAPRAQGRPEPRRAQGHAELHAPERARPRAPGTGDLPSLDAARHAPGAQDAGGSEESAHGSWLGLRDASQGGDALRPGDRPADTDAAPDPAGSGSGSESSGGSEGGGDRLPHETGTGGAGAGTEPWNGSAMEPRVARTGAIAAYRAGARAAARLVSDGTAQPWPPAGAVDASSAPHRDHPSHRDHPGRPPVPDLPAPRTDGDDDTDPARQALPPAQGTAPEEAGTAPPASRAAERDAEPPDRGHPFAPGYPWEVPPPAPGVGEPPAVKVPPHDVWGRVGTTRPRTGTSGTGSRPAPSEAHADPGSPPAGGSPRDGDAAGRLPQPRRSAADGSRGSAPGELRGAATAEGDGADRRGNEPSTGGRPYGGSYHGPTTPLAAERARQARIGVVGAVTERWAPEQAGPVHANWQLAPHVGPATDLWALGALLFRAVQGHAPFPEESAAELVQLVCAEPPASAEECGPLRPVVESLLRQDPTERPGFEEVRGWLRSLVRSAPEPDLGRHAVTVPALGAGAPADSRRLPVVRRRGELVRRRGGSVRRRGSSAAPGPPRADRGPGGRSGRTVRDHAPAVPHGRHKREPHRRDPNRRDPHKRDRQPRLRGSRSLGRTLVGLVLLALVAAVAYALLFMPRTTDHRGQGGPGDRDRTGVAGATSAPAPAAPGENAESGKGKGNGHGRSGTHAASQEPQSADPAGLPKGFALRKDPAGFAVAVPEGWERRGEDSRGQVRYLGGDYELLAVPGRDAVADFGGDPMAYQQDREQELKPFRDSQWAAASGLRRIDVGDTAMAEGAFTWKDGSGREVYARNLAMIVRGRYHVLMVIGPADERAAVTRFYEHAADTYRTTH